MRSILLFVIIALITILIPAIVMSIVSLIGGGDLLVIIGQMLIILTFVLIFTRYLKYKRKYEIDTENMISGQKDIEKLKKLRDERKTYQSKAAITYQILANEFSDEEAANLKKYATRPSDMEHYYSALIDNAIKEKRDEIRKKRDYFLNRYSKKAMIYPDFKGNLKTSGKWIGFFFLLYIIYSIIGNEVPMSEFVYASYVLMGMLILAVVMINTILWIVRTLSSYWAKDYI